MPFINSKITTKLTKDQETEIKTRLGKAIELIPGKTERWLMLAFEPETTMYFRGDNSNPIAFIDVNILRDQPRDAVDRMTAEITNIYHEVLDIAPENIYISYKYYEDWGWNGANF